MNLPPEFISIITNTFGEDGEQLIANLPTLIAEASARWRLTNVQRVANLSYNFVAFAKREDDTVALKIGVPRDELTSEIAALRLFNGEGACRLIDADEEKGFLLLERLNPGVMLSTLEDDEERIDILHEQLGFECERIREWGLAHAVLSAWWSIEDHGDWRYAANFAEMIADLS